MREFSTASFAAMKELEQIVRLKTEAFALDSTSIKAHADGTGAEKTGRSPSAARAEAGIPSTLSFAADARTAANFRLSPGRARDAPERRALLRGLGPMPEGPPLLMDRACEDEETRALARSPGMVPVVPPQRNRRLPWSYDWELYKRRNEIERLFRRLKGYRRVFTRFGKLDVLHLGFLCLALVVEALR